MHGFVPGNAYATGAAVVWIAIMQSWTPSNYDGALTDLNMTMLRALDLAARNAIKKER